ncbi:MAG TPA: hypothetical protein VKZ41_00210 [Gemmatimonadales bacterium]|nr:hypothetical protein [Gemmatimonadales bacterium]
MRISTDELRRATDVLLRHLEQSGHGAIEIEKDFYWSVSPDERYDLEKQPTELGVGQLSDDIAEVRAIVEGQKAPVGYALVWLSSILRAVGEEVVG